jgi:hypothetical protein
MWPDQRKHRKQANSHIHTPRIDGQGHLQPCWSAQHFRSHGARSHPHGCSHWWLNPPILGCRTLGSRPCRWTTGGTAYAIVFSETCVQVLWHVEISLGWCFSKDQQVGKAPTRIDGPACTCLGVLVWESTVKSPAFLGLVPCEMKAPSMKCFSGIFGLAEHTPWCIHLGSIVESL